MYGEKEHCGLKSVIKGEWRNILIPVPLKSIKISCQLINYVAEVTVEQEYQNVEEGPIECEYMFPIEEESAVISFTAQLEGKTLESKVKPNKEAEADYDKAVSEGRTGFLAQSVRPDILKIKVGHLSPGAKCSIKLTYILEAALDVDKIRLTIPTTISPKYIPFHDNSEEANKIKSIKYDFNTPAPMTFSIGAKMKSKIESVTSPSHSIQTEGLSKDVVNEQGFFTSKTSLSASTTDLDRDIIILVKCEAANASVVLREDDADSTVLMVSLVPKLTLKSDPELDIVFLIDCSGSMMGSSIKLARDAINILLHSLPHTAYFNIVRFGSSYKKLFDSSVPYSDETLATAKKAMKKLEADLGGTEILSPLKMLLEEKTKLPRRVFVLTDGSVSNSMECLKLAQKHNNNSKVFALGIGSAADRHLVKGLARAGLGTSEFTTEGEMIAPKVIKQLKHCLQPNLKDVTINWGNDVDINNSSQAPSKIPSLYNGSRVQIFRIVNNKGTTIPATIKISADVVAEGEEGFDEEVSVDESGLQGTLLHKMFARKLIQELEEKEEMADEKEVKELITELAMKYQLMSKHTSIVAVDDKENKNSQPMQSRSIANQMPSGFHGFQQQQQHSRGGAPRMMMCAAPMAFGAAPMGAMGFFSMKSSMKKRAQPQFDNSSVEYEQCAAPMMRMRTQCDSYKQSVVDCCDDEDLEDCESEESMEDSSPMDTVLALIALQTAAGYFTKDKKIFSALNIQEEAIEKLVEETKADSKIVYTVLVCVALEKKFSDFKSCWELVVEKAEAYLNKNSASVELKDKIAALFN